MSDTIEVISQHVGLRHQVHFLTDDGEFIRSRYVTVKTPASVNGILLFDKKEVNKGTARELWGTLNDCDYDVRDLQAEAIIDM